MFVLLLLMVPFLQTGMTVDGFPTYDTYDDMHQLHRRSLFAPSFFSTVGWYPGSTAKTYNSRDYEPRLKRNTASSYEAVPNSIDYFDASPYDDSFPNTFVGPFRSPRNIAYPETLGHGYRRFTRSISYPEVPAQTERTSGKEIYLTKSPVEAIISRVDFQSPEVDRTSADSSSSITHQREEEAMPSSAKDSVMSKDPRILAETTLHRAFPTGSMSSNNRDLETIAPHNFFRDAATRNAFERPSFSLSQDFHHKHLDRRAWPKDSTMHERHPYPFPVPASPPEIPSHPPLENGRYKGWPSYFLEPTSEETTEDPDVPAISPDYIDIEFLKGPSGHPNKLLYRRPVTYSDLRKPYYPYHHYYTKYPSYPPSSYYKDPGYGYPEFPYDGINPHRSRYHHLPRGFPTKAADIDFEIPDNEISLAPWSNPMSGHEDGRQDRKKRNLDSEIEPDPFDAPNFMLKQRWARQIPDPAFQAPPPIYRNPMPRISPDYADLDRGEGNQRNGTYIFSYRGNNRGIVNFYTNGQTDVSNLESVDPYDGNDPNIANSKGRMVLNPFQDSDSYSRSNSMAGASSYGGSGYGGPQTPTSGQVGFNF